MALAVGLFLPKASYAAEKGDPVVVPFGCTSETHLRDILKAVDRNDEKAVEQMQLDGKCLEPDMPMGIVMGTVGQVVGSDGNIYNILQNFMYDRSIIYNLELVSEGKKL